MKNVMSALAMLAAMTAVSAAAQDAEVGSKVVAEGEACPEGMIVSGMGGGQGQVSKVCIRPNTDEMPSDTEDVGDPDTEGHENSGD